LNIYAIFEETATQIQNEIADLMKKSIKFFTDFRIIEWL